MNTGITVVIDGSVTSPVGFSAGTVSAGIKSLPGALDLALLVTEPPASAAGVFTRNRFRAAPVVLSEKRLKSGRSRAIVVNAGCANAGTGSLGYENAGAMTRRAADNLGIAEDEVLVASTGVIGRQLPMDRIKAGLDRIALSDDGGHDFARAIMTTDLVPKEIAVSVPEFGFTVGGCAKGSGMIHPDMATMLAFITTDAAPDPRLLRELLWQKVGRSFNLISVDGDTSTNDSVFLLANGLSGTTIEPDTNAYEAFSAALEYVCVYLAKAIARDGEGATRLVELEVRGTTSDEDARKIIRTVLSSPLVKTAVHGGDPNWGRIVAAAGRSGVDIEIERLSLTIGDIKVIHQGQPVEFDKSSAAALMSGREVSLCLDLGSGSSSLTGWGCDMSEEYIRINADYST
ncbi:MAG: bifunctional glutamate N-acetyltransferase/amino-acid acetyltransferase ArgJ [Dehalogenimonas sp.]|uniref:Arginine biosynthesis bifunctional protein ArgJ n=1 Tax=Candidatus Dehalogenimonas loeffleri TaxID=3127115 RepID=A0ABZ2J3J7_9CHLR|nr:bifunctional glutamate N-acetyltransferase/amino-acid acetyltransferase ArgJ [Dehalogenimonas sp.]